jgi:hypothetical protein
MDMLNTPLDCVAMVIEEPGSFWTSFPSVPTGTSDMMFSPPLFHFVHFTFDHLFIQHTVCGLSPQLVCSLFRMVFPPILPVGLTNSLKEYWDLTDFTGLLSSPKFGLLDPISQCHGRAIAQGRDQVGENEEEGKTFLF